MSLTNPIDLHSHIAQLAAQLAQSLDSAASTASRGRVLADCESLLLDQGRQFLRDCLTATLTRQVDAAEKKAVLPEPAPVATPPVATKVLPPVMS